MLVLVHTVSMQDECASLKNGDSIDFHSAINVPKKPVLVVVLFYFKPNSYNMTFELFTFRLTPTAIFPFEITSHNQVHVEAEVASLNSFLTVNFFFFLFIHFWGWGG